MIIEVKSFDSELAKEFDYFSDYFPTARRIQVVKNIKREQTHPSGVCITRLIPWLATFKIL